MEVESNLTPSKEAGRAERSEIAAGSQDRLQAGTIAGLDEEVHVAQRPEREPAMVNGIDQRPALQDEDTEAGTLERLAEPQQLGDMGSGVGEDRLDES